MENIKLLESDRGRICSIFYHVIMLIAKIRQSNDRQNYINPCIDSRELGLHFNSNDLQE
jgi:hypothetical protein